MYKNRLIQPVLGGISHYILLDNLVFPLKNERRLFFCSESREEKFKKKDLKNYSRYASASGIFFYSDFKILYEVDENLVGANLMAP